MPANIFETTRATTLRQHDAVPLEALVRVVRSFEMDIVGLLAAACVLATFCMQSMFALRAFAIASNVLFIFYGATAHLLPIVFLHALLLPINGWSLGRQLGGPPLATKVCIVMTCWSGMILVVILGSDLARAGTLAIGAVRDWLAR